MSNIQANVLEVLDQYETERFKHQLRVVEYIVDSKAYPPKLEKRQYHKIQGKWKIGKLMTLNYKDVENIVANWSVLKKTMLNSQEPEEKEKPF